MLRRLDAEAGRAQSGGVKTLPLAAALVVLCSSAAFSQTLVWDVSLPASPKMVNINTPYSDLAGGCVFIGTPDVTNIPGTGTFDPGTPETAPSHWYLFWIDRNRRVLWKQLPDSPDDGSAVPDIFRVSPTVVYVTVPNVGAPGYTIHRYARARGAITGGLTAFGQSLSPALPVDVFHFFTVRTDAAGALHVLRYRN